MIRKLLLLSYLITLLLFTSNSNLSAQVGNVTGISVSGNTLNLQCGTDLVVFRVCTENVIMVNLRPNGIESPDTLVIGNTTWTPVIVFIDTSSDPIKITTSKFKLEINKFPLRFHAYNGNGALLCNESSSMGISPTGISLSTSGGNFYGIHNHRDGGLQAISGNVFAGSQGEAGAPFIWTTKGWGILADMESGSIDYSTNTINLIRGGGGGANKNVWWSPVSPTKNDTITVYTSTPNSAKLHWGVNYVGYNWVQPYNAYWPAGSSLYSDNIAVESPFNNASNGIQIAKIGPFNNPAQDVNSFAFVIHNNDGSWDNNSGNDYHINLNSTDSSSQKIDMEVYLIFGSPKEIINGMTDITGKPPLFPEYTLGFLNSQWGMDQTKLFSYVNTYRSKQIPIDAYILDFDWMNWGEYA